MLLLPSHPALLFGYDSIVSFSQLSTAKELIAAACSPLALETLLMAVKAFASKRLDRDWWLKIHNFHNGFSLCIQILKHNVFTYVHIYICIIYIYICILYIYVYMYT